MLPLVQPGIQPKSTVIFFLLEHVAAFTLLGFLTAQYQGRDVHQFRATLPRLLAISITTSVLLQVARGYQPEHGASLALFVFTQFAALLGGWIYVLQRAHVQALVQRRRLLAELSVARSSGSNSAPSLGR
jgi:VanZ family protein